MKIRGEGIAIGATVVLAAAVATDAMVGGPPFNRSVSPTARPGQHLVLPEVPTGSNVIKTLPCVTEGQTAVCPGGAKITDGSNGEGKYFTVSAPKNWVPGVSEDFSAVFGDASGQYNNGWSDSPYSRPISATCALIMSDKNTRTVPVSPSGMHDKVPGVGAPAAAIECTGPDQVRYSDSMVQPGQDSIPLHYESQFGGWWSGPEVGIGIPTQQDALQIVADRSGKLAIDESIDFAAARGGAVIVALKDNSTLVVDESRGGRITQVFINPATNRKKKWTQQS